MAWWFLLKTFSVSFSESKFLNGLCFSLESHAHFNSKRPQKENFFRDDFKSFTFVSFSLVREWENLQKREKKLKSIKNFTHGLFESE